MPNGNGNAITAATDHALVKTFTPLVVAALLGIVGWLFGTVLDLEETVSQNIIHLEHLHEAEKTFEKQMEDLDKTVTDLRINLGRLTAH
tara:strand:- start:294 stop:560 length:267 start_codon:yes stop_codon:yes gene_type:complete